MFILSFVIFGLYVVFLNTSSINLNILNVVLIFVLVAINAVYVRATNQIVREAQKDRKIRYLEKRLKNLYSPLKYDPGWINIFPPLFHDDPQYPEYRDFLNKIRENVHLASPELREELKIFLNGIDNYARLQKSKEVGGPEWKEFVRARKKIKSIANEDIEKILQELEKLTS